MEQEQNESAGVSFDSIHTDDRSFNACPYLGLDKDPQTSIAFPHQSNQCHRMGTPVGIDLAYQGGYCLSGAHAGCHVYGQEAAATPAKEPQRDRLRAPLPAFALPSLKALPSLEGLPSLKTRLDFLKLRFLSFRLSLLLFKLRLRSRMPQPSELQESWSKLKQDLPSFDQARDSLKSRIPADKLTVQSFKQMDLRLFAIPLMLLLILFAAIIWWPPPGETEQDAIAAGASMPLDLSASGEVGSDAASPTLQDTSQPDSSAASLDETAAPAVKPVRSGANDQPAQTDALNDVSVLEALEKSTDSLEAAAGVGNEDRPELEVSAVSVEPAVIEDETAVVNSSEQANDSETAAAEQAEADASDILPAAAIASIGPRAETLNPQEIYESRAPLFLHVAPGDDADVVVLITEQQPATILGRDSSGEWLLVRLAGGIEGWANAALSGADIPTANLPAVNGVPAPASDGETEIQAPDLPVVLTAVVNIGALNVRAGPGIEFESIGVVYNKEEVSLLEQPGSNGWVQVRLAGGQLGWLNSSYLILPG